MLLEMLTRIKETTMKKFITGLNAVIILLLFTVPVHAGPALETVQTQVNKILDVLRDPALKAESARKTKEEKIFSIINEVFDYTELSKRTLGRNWKKLNNDQREEFKDLFSSLLGSVYIDRIIDYSDEKVVFNKETALSEKKAEVQSEIVTSSKTIPIFYRMILKNGQWKVYDVLIEGISLVKNYRSQFKEILKKQPPEDLLEILRKKVGQA
jgi:phospholipid transport system substrate-binding protein